MPAVATASATDVASLHALSGVSGRPQIFRPSVSSAQRKASYCYFVCSPGAGSLSAESHEKALATASSSVPRILKLT